MNPLHRIMDCGEVERHATFVNRAQFSNGKRWIAHDSRRRWCETVPPVGESIDGHLYQCLYR